MNQESKFGMPEKEKSLQNILDSLVDEKKIFGTSFAIKKDNSVWFGASGNLPIDRPYYIASTTKLFTTAIILQLKSEGKLNLNDKISKYLDNSTIEGLHIYNGFHHSNSITIKQLLAHTSGLPDYFQDHGVNGISLENELVNGNDQPWAFAEVIERTKVMKPLFAPNTKNRAHYSDTNFQLLGKIIENITDRTFSKNCMSLIITPLGLSKTYLYLDSTDTTPQPLYYKSKPLHIPKAMASFGPDGGVVSTSSDMLVFIEAFFTGKLFPLSYIASLQQWNKIFFPMQSGLGIHKFKLPWIFNPAGTIPYFIGHSGLSGALAFHSPKEKLFIAGTVNQTAHPDISFRAMIKLAQTFLKK